MYLTRKTMVIPLILLMGANIAHAGKSKEWRANNHNDYTVKVFWSANNCAGVKVGCDGDGVPFTCESEILQPGEEASYRFPGGTYNRTKWVCRMDRHKGVLFSTEERKANEIVDDGGYPKWENW